MQRAYRFFCRKQTRGALQVLAVPLSNAVNAAISGLAGIGHILTGTGIVLLLLALQQSAPAEQA